MTLPPFSAVPIEAENGLPGSPRVYGHMYSDGPYEITSYTPKKSIMFARNPVWKASTDPLRKAYVNAINVDETGSQATIYQQMATGSPSLGMSFDALVPPAAYPQLLNLIKSGSHLVNLGATYQTNPYLVFNTVSPDNGGALGRVAMRQALSYGIERSQLIKTSAGPRQISRSSTSCRRAPMARRMCPAVTTRTHTTRAGPGPCSRARVSPRATRCC